MKILITEPTYFPKDIEEELEKHFSIVSKKTSRDELIKEISDADIVIVRALTKIDKEVLDSAKNLKLICSMTAGLDHIDMVYAASKGIEVFNSIGYATTATAEYTFSIIMNLLRKIPWGFESLKNGRWEDRSKFLGTELEGKTVGVIGFGRIGSRVGKYAKAFGANVIYYDPYVNKYAVKEIGAQEVSFNDLLKTSDIVTIHSFLSKETESMISKKEIEMMKENSFIVNIARGKIINESDLLEALKSKRIMGAALDVFECEPLDVGSPLVKYATENTNLVLTPHLAGSTSESIRSAAQIVKDHISAKFINPGG